MKIISSMCAAIQYSRSKPWLWSPYIEKWKQNLLRSVFFTILKKTLRCPESDVANEALINLRKCHSRRITFIGNRIWRCT